MATPRTYDNRWTSALNHQLTHPAWDEGFTFYDLIWPLFLLIVGVTIPTSLERRRVLGASRIDLYIYIARRTFLVFLIGVLLTGLLSYNLSGLMVVRWWGVLPRIAVCYCIATLLVIPGLWRTQFVVSVALLGGYWVAPMTLEINGYGPGVTSKQNCWVYACGHSDNFVTTPLSLPSLLLGVWVGNVLRSSQSPGLAVVKLALSGGSFIAVAYAWSCWLPMIKRIRSSTYVVCEGGWSVLLLEHGKQQSSGLWLGEDQTDKAAGPSRLRQIGARRCA